MAYKSITFAKNIINVERKKIMGKKRINTETPQSVQGQPNNSFELINKYGTYNIQPTNDSDNEYPAIAQGISEISKKERRRDETTSP